MTYWIE